MIFLGGGEEFLRCWEVCVVSQTSHWGHFIGGPTKVAHCVKLCLSTLYVGVSLSLFSICSFLPVFFFPFSPFLFLFSLSVCLSIYICSHPSPLCLSICFLPHSVSLSLSLSLSTFSLICLLLRWIHCTFLQNTHPILQAG